MLCCEENRALLAVGHRNGAQEGPLYNTDYLLRWNYADGTSDKVPIQSQAYITSAVFDKSDLLYVDYEAADARIAWSLIRCTEAGKTTLASGQADSYDRVPALFTLDKQPMYLLAEDSGLSVCRVDGGKVSTVLTVPDCTMPGPVAVCSNGTQYAFLAAVNGAAYGTVFICDGSGILRRRSFPSRLPPLPSRTTMWCADWVRRMQMRFPMNPFLSAMEIQPQPTPRRPCGGWPEAAIAACMLTGPLHPTSSIRIRSRPIPLQ